MIFKGLFRPKPFCDFIILSTPWYQKTLLHAWTAVMITQPVSLLGKYLGVAFRLGSAFSWNSSHHWGRKPNSLGRPVYDKAELFISFVMQGTRVHTSLMFHSLRCAVSLLTLHPVTDSPPWDFWSTFPAKAMGDWLFYSYFPLFLQNAQ